jgi:predicted ATPase/class 3 adenylate cyclase
MEGPAREVRKTVTILFCDLVHSTGLAEGVDPETYRRVQSRYFEEMRAVIERHGGTVEKFIGDEVMAVFGVPAAHEDDALRAVRAATAMRRRIKALNEELDRIWGVRLQVRIGVNTGEVIAGDPRHEGSFVSGEPVIVAKRLEQAAEPGEIMIGKATYPLVRHAVTPRPLERVQMKDMREEVGRRRVFEVDRHAPGIARRLDAPIVGREEELGLLQGAFERVAGERSCRVFTLLGAAGIGKSRLVTELIASLGDRATAAVGRCLPYGEGITFWPLKEVLESVGGEEAIGRALGDVDHRETVLELLAGATGSSGAAGSSEETFWAVRRAFEALAHERPLVVCFEDVHWAESTLLDLIEYVVGWCRGAPIFVVCLARPDLVERRPTWIAPQPNADALALEPLSAAEAERLLDHLTVDGSLDGPARERIAATAEGNPLFLEQIAAVAAEREEGAELTIPPSIQALLVERLDRLGTEERSVLERASVVGRDFSLAAVGALFPEEQRDTLSRNLLALVRTGLVRPDPGPAAQEDRFRFHHVLVRDTAYEALPKELRAALHERLADWADASTRGHELVGYHLEQAYRARVQIGPRDERAAELALRAGNELLEAGRLALARDDAPAAIRLLERASGLLEEDAAGAAAALTELGSALRESGALERAEAVLEQAFARASRSGRLDLRARSLVARAWLRAYVDPEVEADDLVRAADEAIELFEAATDDLGLARALILVAEAEWLRGECSRMEQVLERALVHAERAGARPERSLILGLLVRVALVGPRPVDDAIALCHDVRRRAGGSVFVEGRADSTLSVLEAMRGRFDEARRLYRSTASLLEEMGQSLWLASLQMYAGIVEMVARDYEAAERELRAGYDRLEQMGERAYLSTMAGFLAQALYELGRFEEARSETAVCEQAASDDDVSSQVLWRGTRAKLLARDGDPAAERLAREAVELALGTEHLPAQGAALADLAETLRLLGRPMRDVLAALERALGTYERKGDLASADTVRAQMDKIAGAPQVDPARGA